MKQPPTMSLLSVLIGVDSLCLAEAEAVFPTSQAWVLKKTPWWPWTWAPLCSPGRAYLPPGPWSRWPIG